VSDSPVIAGGAGSAHDGNSSKRAGRGGAVRRLGGGLAGRVRLWHLLAIIALVYLFFLASDFALYLAGLMLIYSISALGLDWLMGHAGQVSIGNAALMALGAYTVVLLEPTSLAVFPIPILAAAVVGGVVGFLIGLPALRLSGLYLALATLALHFIVATSLDQYDKFSKHFDGFLVRHLTIGPYQLDYGIGYIAFLLAVVALIAFLLNNLYRTSPGREWRAIAEGEKAATAIGVDNLRGKLVASLEPSSPITSSTFQPRDSRPSTSLSSL
jgi:branched-chain amino acid transport system permease protein